MRLKGMQLALAGAFVCLFSTAGHALTIDFSAFATGDTGLSTLTVGDATFDVPGGTVFTYAPGAFGAFNDSGGVCALAPGFNCQMDWTMTFAYAVTNLVFDAAFYNDFDSVEVEAFNGLTSLGTLSVNADGTYGFGGAVLTSLVFNDSSTGAGFGFGDFEFEAAAVPEPGTLFLFGAGAMALFMWRRRRA